MCLLCVRACRITRVCVCVSTRTYQSLESRHKSAASATGWRERLGRRCRSEPLITDKDRLAVYRSTMIISRVPIGRRPPVGEYRRVRLSAVSP